VTLISADNPLGLDRRDPDAKDDITAINQLTVPVNRPVLIHLTSKDVVHSFTLYEMRVKQDAMPGTDTPVWFIPTTTTEEMRRRLGDPKFEFEIACSQLCGLGHYRMRGFLTVDTQEEFDAYLAQEAQALPR
jgi:cytochrome c oxidase subunit 2